MNTVIDTVEHERMEDAYYEYRKACYNILYEHAKKRDMTSFISDGVSIEELNNKFCVLPERKKVLELYLDALVKFGAVEFDRASNKYKNSNHNTVDLDENKIAYAVGKDNVDTLIHSDSYKGLIDTFSEKENKVAADFVAKNIGLWDEFLQQPFYAYGRQLAVKNIAFKDAKVLDIACGPGFGLSELAEKVGPKGEVVGLEYSHDFASEAMMRMKDRPNIRVLQADVDEAFPFLQENYFNGSMLIGAFHFLKRKMDLFKNINRVLVPGGKFCIGYAYMNFGTYDQEVMDLRLKLRQPPTTPTEENELFEAARAAGFELESKEGTIGCFGWYLFVKK